MSPLFALLESFYLRHRPRGVAFVGSAKLGVWFGKPFDPDASYFEGFKQTHSEHHSSTYTSYFGRGKVLIAEFDFQDDYPPPTRPWLAFVRLAALIQRYLDNPSEFGEPPSSEVPVLKPDPPGPRLLSLRAEVPIENEGVDS